METNPNNGWRRGESARAVALGSYVRDLRLSFDLTQEGLANLVQTNQSTISRLEAGLSFGEDELLASLAKVLDVPEDHLRALARPPSDAVLREVVAALSIGLSEVPIDRGLPKVLIGEVEIRSMVRDLAERIRNDYPAECPPILIVLLKGGWMLAADLVRALPGLRCQIEFVSVGTFGSCAWQQSAQYFELAPRLDLEGRDCLVVDDYVETGQNVKFVCDEIKKARPQSVRVCALLISSAVEEARMPEMAYYGCVVDQSGLVGYGMDDEEQYRHLKYVGYFGDDAVELPSDLPVELGAKV